jgi:hypothetical protein
MTVPHRADLEMIHETFYGKSARRGKKMILKFDLDGAGDKARWLLRHHRERKIKNRETWLRDDIDYLLSYYSILEIAITAGVVAFHPDDPLFEAALQCLDYPPLRSYYKKHYPLMLPDRLLSRKRASVGETLKYRSRNATEAIRQKQLLSAFLPLTADFENDDDLESFLWILDGGVRGNWDYGRLEKILKRPKEAAALLMKSGGSNGRHVIRGMIKFIEFAVSLDKILDEAKDFPNLQEEMYLYYSYWFASSEDLVERILGLMASLDAVGGDVEVPKASLRKLRERAKAF